MKSRGILYAMGFAAIAWAIIFVIGAAIGWKALAVTAGTLTACIIAIVSLVDWKRGKDA